MARFYGKVGYGIPGEFTNGVWSDGITERDYYGDVLNESRSIVTTDNVNDDLRLTQRISIVADAFAIQNYLRIKYVENAGALWVVTTANVERPRIILTLGGIYVKPTT
jgi:hypothetical protein